jgi:hypothetical protein
MPVFEPQQAITTDTPKIEVAAGLKPGRYRFQLVVIDAQGNASEPAEQEVEIVAPPSPPVVQPPIDVRPPIVVRPPVLDPPVVVRSPRTGPFPIPRPPLPINRPPRPNA